MCTFVVGTEFTVQLACFRMWRITSVLQFGRYAIENWYGIFCARKEKTTDLINRFQKTKTINFLRKWIHARRGKMLWTLSEQAGNSQRNLYMKVVQPIHFHNDEGHCYHQLRAAMPDLINKYRESKSLVAGEFVEQQIEVVRLNKRTETWRWLVSNVVYSPIFSSTFS